MGEALRFTMASGAKTLCEKVDRFNKDKWTLRGERLYWCPVLQLQLDVAAKEVKWLIDGEETEYVVPRRTLLHLQSPLSQALQSGSNY